MPRGGGCSPGRAVGLLPVRTPPPRSAAAHRSAYKPQTAPGPKCRTPKACSEGRGAPGPAVSPAEAARPLRAPVPAPRRGDSGCSSVVPVEVGLAQRAHSVLRGASPMSEVSGVHINCRRRNLRWDLSLQAAGRGAGSPRRCLLLGHTWPHRVLGSCPWDNAT